VSCSTVSVAYIICRLFRQIELYTLLKADHVAAVIIAIVAHFCQSEVCLMHLSIDMLQYILFSIDVENFSVG